MLKNRFLKQILNDVKPSSALTEISQYSDTVLKERIKEEILSWAELDNQTLKRNQINLLFLIIPFSDFKLSMKIINKNILYSMS